MWYFHVNQLEKQKLKVIIEVYHILYKEESDV